MLQGEPVHDRTVRENRGKMAPGSQFSEFHTLPTDASVYASPAALRRPAQDSRSRWSRFSFLVGLLHPLPYAGLSRRTCAPATPPLRLSADLRGLMSVLMG